MTLALIALLVLGAAAAAMFRRNLVHSALLLVVSWAGLAAFYLWAGAEFVAFAQVLVYVGAVSMVVLFAVLLTRPALEPEPPPEASVQRAFAAVLAAGAVAGVLGGAVLSAELRPAAVEAPVLTVREIGLSLMGPHAAALLAIGVLLTVALLGAIVIAAPEARTRKEDAP